MKIASPLSRKRERANFRKNHSGREVQEETRHPKRAESEIMNWFVQPPFGWFAWEVYPRPRIVHFGCCCWEFHPPPSHNFSQMDQSHSVVCFHRLAVFSIENSLRERKGKCPEELFVCRNRRRGWAEVFWGCSFCCPLLAFGVLCRCMYVCVCVSIVIMILPSLGDITIDERAQGIWSVIGIGERRKESSKVWVIKNTGCGRFGAFGDWLHWILFDILFKGESFHRCLNFNWT